jgi:3-hydroxyisobutyrate dehydrogenase
MPQNSGGAKRIGLVGLGTMGAPMARCLAKAGHALALYDIAPELTQALAAELNGLPARSPAELGAQCSVVITMLPNAQIVRAAVTGGDGVAAGLEPGGIIVDMSSSYPLATLALGAELEAAGIALLDAPVSGGVQKAIDGTLAIMLGGHDEAAMAAATPVLEAMGTVYRTGALGSGHATKALNNYVSAAGLAAACEAVIVGKAFGLDPARMIDVINAS